MLFFHLKNSFRSQDIEIVMLTFYRVEKNGLTRKIYDKQLQCTYCPISHKVKADRQ